MRYGDINKSTFIKVEDLGGEPLELTIKKVTMEGIGNPPQEKAVVWFDENTRGLVLNKTNTKRLGELYGKRDTDDWIGKKITLFPSQTEFGGKSVPCIRIGPSSTKKPAAGGEQQAGA